ncbi:MAG: phosphatidylserine decarboxylase [Sulfurospirillum sp.]|nr:phosphatidylserine decarboxylase [Sulfurospirillum sp.]MBL0703674.1 phosphatidylserine decarboxylase [Sulfurospirillum sp.]
MKINTTTQLIAKEGWKYIFFVSVLFLLSLWLDFFSWVFFVILIFTIYLFRNPERVPVENDDKAIFSPNDGSIINISKAKYIDGKDYTKIEIEKPLLEASLLRAPTKMSLDSIDRRHGLCLPISSLLNKKLGEKVTLTCKCDYDNFFINVKSGIFARKIEIFKTIRSLKLAQRFGFLVDGDIEFYLPLDFRVKVSIGDRVKAGESVLGYFAYKGNK